MPLAMIQTALRLARASSGFDTSLALDRFAAGDKDAFAELVTRFGPMVLGVSRRVLGPTPDADDAFQSTFLALLRHAGSIRDPGSLPGWLHRTALNAARKMKGRPIGPVQSEPLANDDPLASASWREVRELLDEELNGLPERFRSPLVLCYLEARTHEGAARTLGISVSTLKRHLDRGRELLRARMIRRGVGAAGLAAAILTTPRLCVAVPGSLLRRVVDGLTARSQTLAAGSAVAPLASAGTPGKIAAVCLSLGLAAGTILLAGSPPSEKQPGGPFPSSNATRAENAADPLPAGAVTRFGTGWLRGFRCGFLPDGKAIVRERADGGLQLFQVPTGKPLTQIRATDVPERDRIVGSTVGFTGDGKLLAAALWDGRCGIWETATGKLVRWFESGLFFSILRCEFSPDGTLLAVGDGVDHQKIEKVELGVYEVASGRKLFSVPGTNGVFAADGKSLVAWNGYGGRHLPARRVSVPDGRVLSEIRHSENFPDAAHRSDGKWFFEVTEDQRVRVRDAATGKLVHTFGEPGEEGGVVYVRHAPGRQELIAIATKPAGIRCWDLTTGKELWQTSLAAPEYFPDLSADGSTLVTGRAETITVWDTATGRKRATISVAPIGHTGTSPLVSADGTIVASSSGGTVRSTAIAFWDTATGRLLSDLPGHQSAITAAVFAPDGRAVYTAGTDRTLRIWDRASGQERARSTVEPAAFLLATADGETLIAGYQDGNVRVLDANTGKIIRQFRALTTQPELVGLVLTADGKRLIAGGRDNADENRFAIRFLDPTTGKKLREFTGTGGKLEQLAIRPDGERIITSHLGRKVMVWSADGKRIAEQTGQSKRESAWASVAGTTPYTIGSVAASPDGRWFGYSDQEEGIVVLDAETGQRIARVELPGVYYQQSAARNELRDVLAFAPDGKTVAWSGVESTAEVFVIEIRSRLVRRKLPGEGYPVQHLAFTPSGRELLSAGPDGSALLWDIAGRHHPKADTKPTPEQIAAWWTALANADPANADGAMRAMASYPGEAIQALRSRLTPARPADPATLKALIEKLAAPAFDDRVAASRALIQLGEAAIALLTEATRSSNPEVARQARAALDAIESGPRLRCERAVEVLERIGRPEAWQLLRDLAAGDAEFQLTRDAKATVERTKW